MCLDTENDILQDKIHMSLKLIVLCLAIWFLNLWQNNLDILPSGYMDSNKSSIFILLDKKLDTARNVEIYHGMLKNEVVHKLLLKIPQHVMRHKI